MAGKAQPAELTPEQEREQLRQDRPESWIAVRPGDEIIGQVIDVQDAWSDVRQGGSYYPLLVVQVETATGYEIPAEGLELKIHAFGGVMYNEVMRRQPAVGERIRLTYQGDRDPTPERAARGYSPTRLFKLDVAGRTDQAKRVYDQIGKAQGNRQRSAPPATAEDFDPPPAASGATDDDVPF